MIQRSKSVIDILETLARLDEVSEEGFDKLRQRKIQPDDVVKGVLGTRARKLKIFIEISFEEIVANAEAINGDFDKTKPEEIKIKILSLISDLVKLSILEEIFWKQVRMELDIPEGSGIEIKEGWTVVVKESKKPTSNGGFLLFNLPKEYLESNNCGNPNCPVHGHLNHQEEKKTDLIQ